MNYTENYEASMEHYKELKARYDELISSKQYFDIVQSMPYKFLNASSFCKKIDMFEQMDHKTRHVFASKEEARVCYHSMVSFPRSVEELLDAAAFVTELESLGVEINRYVEENAYLPSNMRVKVPGEFGQLAREILEMLPKYKRSIPKAFYYNFVESAILSLPTEDLVELCEQKVILPMALDGISISETANSYKEKLDAICKALGRSSLYTADYDLSLKGVTFANDDGTSRQEILAELAEYVRSHPGEPVSLEVVPYTFTPEIGDPEPAMRVEWGGKTLGNLAKGVAIECAETLVRPVYSADLCDITGGFEGGSYGCKIRLHIEAEERKARAVEPERAE